MHDYIDFYTKYYENMLIKAKKRMISLCLNQNTLNLFMPSPACLNSSTQDILNAFSLFLASLIIDFQVLLIWSRYKSPTTMQTSLALDRATFNLFPSDTNPMVFLWFIFFYFPVFDALTALNIITSFYLPWNESIVFTSAFTLLFAINLTWAL